MNLALPPNPPACAPLKDPDRERLKALYPDLWVNPATSCLTCATKGTFRWYGEDGQVATYDCDCRAQWVLHRWMLNAGIDTKYQRLSWLDAMEIPQSGQDAVMDYVEHADANVRAGVGMILYARSTGSGKTLALTLALKALLARGYDCYFTQFNEMLDAFSSGWRDEDQRKWFIRRIRNAGVLVIDDLGREYKGRIEITEAMFDQVIRARVAASRPTLLTTNLTPDEWKTGYGRNVMSLLDEACMAVEVSGADFRERARDRYLSEARAGLARPLVIG